MPPFVLVAEFRMFYESARDQIGNGDLLFFRGRLLHSRLIQRWTRSVYSHVGIACWVGGGFAPRLAVIEAMEGSGVRLYPLTHYLTHGDAVDWYELTDERVNRAKVVEWAIDRWGKGYARPRQFLRSFVTVPLFNWLGLPTKIDGDRWFCSQFASEALRAGGWVPPEDDDVLPELSSPGDVSLFTCLRRRGPLVMG